MPTLDTSSFYADLPANESDEALTDERSYHPAPPDWLIFVTDVRGSTAAVAGGRYKEVNTLGAASIICAQNACPGVDFPFVFGGDGATLLVPPSARGQVTEALLGLRKKSLAEFGLDLRIGCVPVSEVHARGARVQVARRKLSEGNDIAMFAGGGVTEATAMIKHPDGAYLIEGAGTESLNVAGLECRWCAVPARHGGVLSLIVHAPAQSLALYRQILADIREIAPQAVPVTPVNLPADWPPRFLMHEAKMKWRGRLSQWLHYLGIAALTGLLTIVVRLTRDKPGSAAALYIDSLCRNTDHLKLDDYLRMVIDVSEDQRLSIERLLAAHQASHGVLWGRHFSDASIFTCMVRSPRVHLHFVDGNGGGYTAAARDMDARRGAIR